MNTIGFWCAILTCVLQGVGGVAVVFEAESHGSVLLGLFGIATSALGLMYLTGAFA